MTEHCLGIKRAQEADCLSDLLLDTHAAWMSQPLLCYREHGRWQWLLRREVRQQVLRVSNWLHATGVQPGDRVGLLGHNSPQWYVADFAVLRAGAILVPAYFTDPPDAVHYLFKDAGCKLLLVEPGEQQAKLDGIQIPTFPLRGEGCISLTSVAADTSFDTPPAVEKPSLKDLATLIYTSGTTGHPKGVMLTHENILADVVACLQAIPVTPKDQFLSFLPLSHAFERTVGHFLPTASGARIAYAESVSTLMRDMPETKPTVMISVPRLYEKIYAGVHEKVLHKPKPMGWLFEQAQIMGLKHFEQCQKGETFSLMDTMKFSLLDRLINKKLRAKLGGKLRLLISGGAALHPNIARFLLASGITICPGYGLSESSPVLAVNREDHIKPDTVGFALPGVELKLALDGELLARGKMVMQGYWNQSEATKEVLHDGWLHTGDMAEIDAEGYVRIVDRKKEVIVLSNGENVAPALVEQHLTMDACILHAMVVGDGQDFLASLIIPDMPQLSAKWKTDHRQSLPENWQENTDVQQWWNERINQACQDLAKFMRVQKISFVREDWTQENGMLTPTLKLKRRKIIAAHTAEIDRFYIDAR